MTAPHLTDAEIAELRRLEAAATPGPWHRFHDSTTDSRCHCGQIWSDHELLWMPAPDESDERQERVADGRLIVAARNALPRLLAEIERLRAAVKSQFTAAFAKLREELGPHLGKGGGLVEILDGIGGMKESIRDLRDTLLRAGYRECDIPACNCNGWHPVGGFYARFQEIDEAVGDHDGKTLLRAVQELRTRAEAAEAELHEARKGAP